MVTENRTHRIVSSSARWALPRTGSVRSQIGSTTAKISLNANGNECFRNCALSMRCPAYGDTAVYPVAYSSL